MFVERIEVEEGFLDNLDITFKPGLNVIIGPRGSGKTSVIELIRFCLGATGVTKRSSEIATQQALAVLGSGQVTVTLNDELFGQIVVSRTGDDDEPRCSYSYDKPLIFSQNEIESIGLQPKNRLNLIDGFTERISSTEGKEQELLATIRSLTIEMRDSSQELDSLSEQIDLLATAPIELKQLEIEQANILKSVAETEVEQKRLAELGGILAALSVRTSVYSRTRSIINKWLQRLDDLIDSEPLLEDWPSAARSKNDQLTRVRELIKDSVDQVAASKVSVEEALSELESQNQTNKQMTTTHDSEARELRKQQEGLKSGAGEAARRVALAREKASQLESLQALKSGKVKQLQALQKKRKTYLIALDASRNARFEARIEIAKTLNNELNPGIEVKVQRSALNADYANTLASLLRGSGLHYATLAPLLAAKMSPRELVEAVELDNATAISEHGEIPAARASKLISHLKGAGLENILTCTIEDGVDFRLMDGTDYKSSEHASMGQRCTIVLPILLRRYTQPLILDQPEDHLDNAFVVGTLIRAIQQRKENAQLILATHNANIPVLGEADLVILMGSDGESGYVAHSGILDDEASVAAITNVMEGGIAAFNQRASFYSRESEI